MDATAHQCDKPSIKDGVPRIPQQRVLQNGSPPVSHFQDDTKGDPYTADTGQGCLRYRNENWLVRSGGLREKYRRHGLA